MNELWAIIYGILQGLTEFLPISSSGHLALLPFFFKIEDPGVFFDLMMHLGTAIAILIYFRSDVKVLFLQLSDIFRTRNLYRNAYAFNFTLATMITVLFILIVKDFALEYGRSPAFIGVNLIVFGILLFISDRFGNSEVDLTKELNVKKSILIGFSQMLAIFPGVSRSGITITSARFSGLSRVNASKFSFLLSLPIIFASILYKSKSILLGEAQLEFNLTYMLIGVVVSFIVGIFTIHFFLKLLKRVGFGIYAIYRVILGLLIFYFIYN